MSSSMPAQNSFAIVPQEIILMIGQHLLPSDLNSLILSSRELYNILDEALYDTALTWKYKKMSIFEWAATAGRLPVVQKLLARGADPDITNEPGWSILHVAALHGHANIVQFLIDAGLPITRDPCGDTLLHQAVNSSSKETVQAVLDSGLDVSASGIYGATALHDAAYNGDIEIVKTLLDAGADVTRVNEYSVTALHSASTQGHTAVCKMLLEAEVQLSARAEPSGASALLLACESGHTETVRYLIEEYNKAGLDIGEMNWKHETGLHMAVRCDHEPVAKILLEIGMGPTIGLHDNTPLYLAISRGYTSHLKLFLDEGIDVNMADRGITLLHRAASKGQLSSLKFLLEHGANPRKACENGMTPLHLAAIARSEPAVKILVEYGADINMCNKWQETPLHLAVASEAEPVCEYLISVGADITIPNNVGWAPLHQAVVCRNVSLVKLLLEGLKRQGGTVSPHIDMEGTPLHTAVLKCHPRLIDLLLSFGADPLQLDGYGRSSIDWAYLEPAAWGVMKKYHSYQPTDRTLTIKALKRAVMGLVDWLRKILGGMDTDQPLYLLGRCLVYLDDLDEARTAFEQFRSFQKYAHCCALCTGFIRTRDHYLCLTCAVVDVCSTCAGGLRNTSVRSHRCQAHQLLCVPPTREEFRSPDKINDRGESLEEWATRIRESHGSPTV